MFLRRKLSYNTLRGLRLLKEYYNVNYLKTLYFNFYSLPLHQAFKFPFIIGKHVKIRNIGDIRIEGDIFPGMISIGNIYIRAWEDNKEDYFIFNNRGIIIFKGRVKFYPATKLFVSGKLEFGGDNNIGSRTHLLCYNSIRLGFNSGCSWDCSIIDTNFHPFGDNVFIGNHSAISMNTVIPNGCVISNYSKVSGSFRREGENLLISGNPAVVIDKGFQMYDFCQF